MQLKTNLKSKNLIVLVFTLMVNLGASASLPLEAGILFENDSLKITSVIARYQDQVNGLDGDYLQLIFVNKIQDNINISWDFELHYDNMCLNCSELDRSPEYHRTINLQPNQTFESSCEKPEDAPYVIFVKYNDIASDVLQDIYLRNVKISTF